MNIYFIRTANFVKIGFASNVAERLSTLQIGCPFNLELLGSVNCGTSAEAAMFEKKIHHMFRYCRVRGEWFTNNVPLRDFRASVCSGMPISVALTETYKATRKKIRKMIIAERCMLAKIADKGASFGRRL